MEEGSVDYDTVVFEHNPMRNFMTRTKRNATRMMMDKRQQETHNDKCGIIPAYKVQILLQ